MSKELQVENGNYTRVVNVVMEKLTLFPFPAQTGLPLKLSLCVIRKTWGFNKKEDYISLTQFEKALDSNRTSIVHWLEYLVKANILVKGESLSKGTLYRFNKYWEQWAWGVKATLLVKARSTRWLRRAPKGSQLALTHKRQLQKTVTKDNTEQSSGEIASLIKSFEEINPAAVRFYGNTTQRKACADLLALYGRERVATVIKNTLPKTNLIKFMPRIFTPLQLYEKWAQLENEILKYRDKNSIIKNKVAFK